MNGVATFVLHTHLPYCRLAGRWPHGEEWLHEAMLECYLPLVRAFQGLASGREGSLGVTINITPILAEQLKDSVVREHFRDYMAGQIGRAQSDLLRFKASGDRRAETAAFHLERYIRLQGFYERDLRGDILAALTELEEAGALEIATSAATHAYLPLLSTPEAVRFQVETGVRSHRRIFGRDPRAFWLPECAYRPGLEETLEAAGVRVFFAETHLVAGGQPRGKTSEAMIGVYDNPHGVIDTGPPLPAQGTTFQPYTVGQSTVSVLARNERTGQQVWSAANGYPGDPVYREFHKKDDQSGLRYWRVTGTDVGLGQKDLYEPRAAAARVLDHAANFHALVRSELADYQAGSGEAGTLVSAYDTELFGHWWLEGVAWLTAAIGAIAADPDITLATASEALTQHPPVRAIDLPEGSWGAGGDARTWMNPGTRWMWEEMAAREQRARGLIGRDHSASQQLARELLLLQSSDWEFLVTTGQATEYATDRFREHAHRFDALADAMEAGAAGLDALASELFALDNPFPNIETAIYTDTAAGV